MMAWLAVRGGCCALPVTAENIPMSSDAYDPQLMTLLEQVVRTGASDLHLLAGSRPTLRLHGRLRALDTGALASEDIHRMITSAMQAVVRERFEHKKDLDFAIAATVGGKRVRFRANVFRNQGSTGACLR